MKEQRLGISGFCIKHKVAPILIFILLVVFGLTQFSNLSLALMPDMDFPYSVVLGVYPGASPEDVEDLVAKPIEEAMAGVSNLKELTSTSSENMCYVVLQFEDGTNMDVANMKMREKLDAVILPEDCQDPTIMNINMDMMPVCMIALTGDDLANLQSTAEKNITPSLERLDGVASVTISGGVTRQAVVEVNPDRMAGYGLSISYISNFLAAANVLYPGGTLENGNQVLNVHTDGKFSSLDDVASTRIALPTGGTIRLDEVASIYWDNVKSDSIARSDGEDCVILSVSKQSGSNTVAAAEAVTATMEELSRDYPNLNYQVIMDQSEYIHLSIHSLIQNIVLAVIIAAIVVFLFLRQLGATATIVISMPVCILTVFVLMRLCNVTMNLMSLGGIGIGVGMIVDNSVVVLENIFRYQADGRDRWASCVQGAREVSMSVIASTLTTVVVFLPVALSQGMVVQMFRDLCLTIVFLILASLLISLTLVPVLCYFFLDEVKVQKRAMRQAARAGRSRSQQLKSRMGRGYQKVLSHFVDHRWRAVIITVVLIILFLGVASRATMILVPDTDQSSISINVSMPIGSEMEKSAEISDRILAIAEREIPEVKSFYYTAQDESSSVVLTLVPMEERDRSAKEIADELRPLLQDIAGCKITLDASGMTSTGFDSSDAEVKITGPDYKVLTAIAADLETRIAALPDAIDVNNAASEQVPQINIYVNNDNAARFGLTTATIGAAVRSELTGATATTMTINGSEIDVVVKGNEASSQSLDALKAMPLPAATGGTIPLSLVADVTIELAPQTITRENQTPSVSVTANSKAGDANALTAAIQAEILDGYAVPDGYFIENGGVMQDIMENFGTLITALLISIVLLYFVLAVQFESFLMPVAIMLIMPIAFSGALFGLPVTGQDISMTALLGLVILAGTVVNSSIILISYINIRRENFEEDKRTAILNACPRRVRPVMITTLTTVLGLMPMALGIGGEGSEMMMPMAIVMISGMVISTILTLLFTPVYYSLIDSLTNQFRKLGRRKRREARAGQEPIFPDIL